MFERFIRLAKAKKALSDRCFEDALALAADPLIRADRRAEEIRGAAVAELLARARRHLVARDLAAARAELVRLRGVAPSADVEAVANEVEAVANAENAAVALARRTLTEVRKSLDCGETAAAAALLATVDPSHLLLERDQLEHMLAERRRQAAELCAGAERLLSAESPGPAIEALQRAQALDRDGGPTVALQQQVVAVAARRVDQALRALLDTDPGAALEHYRTAVRQLPHLVEAEAMAPVRAHLCAALRRALRATRSLEEAVPLAAAVNAADLVGDDQLTALCSAIVHAATRTGRGENGPAAERLRRAAAAVGADGLVEAAATLAADATQADQRMAAVHALVEQGQLEAARASLLELLAKEPLHELARRELELVDQGLGELDRRLEAVRVAARAGRLREACTAALALAGSPRVAAEAQQLVTDVRARMAVVDRGLDEVRVALHGRIAAGVEGVRHCLRRLEELAKVQTDHEQLPAMTAAVAAEITALGLCDTATKAMERQAIDEAFPVVLELLPVCDRLIARDRLEARLVALADRVRSCGEAALAAGRLATVDRCAELLDKLESVRGEFGDRGESLRAAASGRRQQAEQLVAEAKARLDRRDLASAERLAEEALGQWCESPVARQLAEQLAEVRRQSEALARVEAMTAQRDFQGARQKLASLPPTQALMRTRVYDMKQNLARAQGLEGAFLLRVDEGGEQLVMRGENVSIGNVRQARADLPILANVAGLHASIRRSMSFHGGMQDTIVAEEGEVRVGGAVATRHPLQPGDRVQLGASLGLSYQRPSTRSLSAAITLLGGFQVAGTDRILLMKDRGRDGRILIGATKDAHVRVPSATGEVEVFATNAGQMRVLSETPGTIDGVPFRGEHPVAAGQLVVAAGLSFLLLPWRPTV